MAKKSNPKKKQFKIEHKGAVYICKTRNGKVFVYTKRTACGQLLLAGIFNLETRTWQTGSAKAPLPAAVKADVVLQVTDYDEK
ncbi:MAG: hypothetical protein Q4B65_00640 [Candidatus Saccharibacteria bacterium]|nr:hypothetical protein [Candidatus Saccharibacteria bacterium]